MGGGASKTEETNNDQKNQNTANKGDAANNRSGPGVTPADDTTATRGLVCTVTDAVTNNQVPFLSSVANVKPKRGARKVSVTPIDDPSAAADAAITFRFEECIVITGSEVVSRSVSSPAASGSASSFAAPVPSATDARAQKQAQNAVDRGNWKSSLGLLEPLSWSSDSVVKPLKEQVSPRRGEGILVGGAFLNGSANDRAALIPAGADEKTTAAAQRAAIFASKTRFAVPTSFHLTTCGGQFAAIRAIASSSDGTQFASVVAPSKTAQYFDCMTGKVIMEIKGHSDPIVAIAHSRDGKFLLTSSTDGTVCMWDLNNGKKLREIGVNSQANSVAISDDSDIIATSSTEDFVNLWESKNGDALTLFQRHSGAVYCVGFSRRGNLVASGSQNGEVFVWGAQVGDVRHHIETGARAPVLCVSFSHDGTRLVTADREILQVWDLFTGGLILTRNGSGDAMLGETGRMMHNPSNFVNSPKDAPRITSAIFAACNTIIVGLTTKRVVVIDPNQGTELLAVDLRALVTCMSVNWSGEVAFIGDFAGNHYRLQMNFAHRDVMEYNLNSKPPARERGKERD